MKKNKFTRISIILLTLFYLLCFPTLAQKNQSYTYVGELTVSEIANPPSAKPTFFFGNSIDYAVYQFAGIWKEDLYNRRENEMYERNKEEVKDKSAMIKQQYSTAATSYPDQITDGWHDVIATDNITFCKNAKVFINNNKIIKFVLDDWIHIKVIAMDATIKKGKSVISLENYNRQQLNIVEVYFMYDLEGSKNTTEPLSPGFVCFWSALKRYDLIIIKVNNEELQRLPLRSNGEPECFSPTMVCRALKPGIYTLEAEGRGNRKWRGTFEVKRNMCLRYKFTK